MGKEHYYRLEGESLAALNRLVEYDTLLADFTLGDTRQKIADLTGRPAPADDGEQQQKLSAYFTSAQIRAYQEKLGFHNPPVQVRNYGGVLYRAYNIFPRLALNPGTAKANFGLGDMFGSSRKPKDRIAFYIAHEDYKGDHFAPPGAVKLSNEEFAAYQSQEDDFEFYNTYPEGTDMPVDFDPTRHWTINYTLPEQLDFTHAFLVQGKAHEVLLNRDKAMPEWHARFQDFFRKDMPPLMTQLTPHDRKFLCGIEEPEKKGEPRVLSLNRLSLNDWETMRDDILQAFTLLEVRPQPMGGCKVFLLPRLEHPIGWEAGAVMAKVPPHPSAGTPFGFEERESLKNKAVFDDKMSGFPYMKIERFEGGDIKLLVFRLPANIQKVDTPADMSPVNIDDYKALSGSDSNLPTHVFRIEGKAYELLAEYDGLMSDYYAKNEAFKSLVMDILQAAAPDFSCGEFKLCGYETANRQRDLRITLPMAIFETVKPALEDLFKFDFIAPNMGYGRDWMQVGLLPNPETEKGQMIAAEIGKIPYEPYFSRALDSYFGFFKNKGYDQMKIEKLPGLAQHAVLYFFPDYIQDVAPPPDCAPLTREEYALLFAESWDIDAVSPPAPRPDHLKHLPVPDGLKHYKRVMSLKEAKDREGLPLHAKSESEWFTPRP